MARYSKDGSTDETLAAFLRGLANLMGAGRVHMKELQVNYEIGVGDRMRTVVSLELVAFEHLDDPRTHPAIIEQPRLGRIGGGPALGPGGRLLLPDGGE